MRALISVWVLFFVWIMPLSAAPSVADLLNNAGNTTHTLTRFKQTAGTARAIKKIRLYFLESASCYEGFRGFYDTPQTEEVFMPSGLEFALNAQQVFAAGVLALPQGAMPAIHCILIRFISESGHFARFLSSCADQDINCAMVVDCVSGSQQCQLQQEVSTQALDLN